MSELRWTLTLPAAPGAYSCWHCGLIGSGHRMVKVDGHAIHLGCIRPAIRRGKL